MTDKESIKEMELKKKIEAWYKQFDESKFIEQIDFEDLSWSQLIITYFCLYMGVKNSLNPEKWDQFEIKSIVGKIMKLDLTGGFSDHIKGVLPAFLRFLQENYSLTTQQKFASLVENMSDNSRKKYNKEKNTVINQSLFNNSFSNPNLPKKLKNKKKWKKWLQKVEECAKNKAQLKELIHELFNFIEKTGIKYRESIEKFYKLCNQQLDFSSREEMHPFYETLTNFILILEKEISGQKTFVDLYQENNKGKDLKERKQNIISKLQNCKSELYQIKEIDSPSYILKDLFTGEEFKLVMFERDFDPGEIIFTRVINFNSYNIEVGPILGIPGNLKSKLIEKIKNNFKKKRNKEPDNFRELKNHVHKNTVEILALIKELINQEPEAEEMEVFEAFFNIQSRKVVYNKLSSLKSTEIEKDQQEDYELFYWIDRDTGSLLGNLVLYENQLLLRTHSPEDREQGINLIKNLLSFTVSLENKRKVLVSPEETEANTVSSSRSKEESQKLVEGILDNSLDFEFLGEKSFRELNQTEKGREILKIQIEIFELENYLDLDSAFFNQYEISLIRKKLDLPGENENIIRDEVEKLIEKNNKDLNKEIIFEGIRLWRDFKNETKNLRGRAKSWAAAVEYLNSRYNHHGQTQKEIGKKYDVSANTISKKYKKIAEVLGINVSGRTSIDIPEELMEKIQRFFNS